MSRDDQLTHPRDQILKTIQRIYRHRMTTTSGGNVSIREPGGEVWITPARIDKGSLRREDIVCVGTDGSVEGPHRPSSELPFHQAIYAVRPDLAAVVHAHPVALVAFSICGKVPDTRLFHQARYVCGETGFAPYALPGSARLGESIAKQFAAGHDCVILENHGVVVGGPTMNKAFARFETLEFTAKTILKASRLGELRYLDDSQLQTAATLEPLPTFRPVRPTSREREVRKQLCDFVRRGYQQRLFISTEGSFSARVDDDVFVITRRGCDRMNLRPEDLVLIDAGRAEEGKRPSQATRNHRAIYRRHPEFQAIVNADPVNATAFTVTGVPLDTRTIPESYIFLRDVVRIPFGVQFTDPNQLAEFVSPSQPIALQENDGALVCGTSILDAFDRLEVLESTAEAVINALSLGEVTPMPDTVIDELHDAFLAG
ncbi:MAG: class II aldolase/adducin family protein [Planctomycetaceae bacterium]|nr:class II aldolase/adducin family protein [Planctomycetaceae bacterium]